MTVDEDGFNALTANLHADGSRQMCFPDAWIADEYNIFGFLKKAHVLEIQNFLPIDAWLKVEIEVFDGANDRKTRVFYSMLYFVNGSKCQLSFANSTRAYVKGIAWRFTNSW